MIETAVMVAFIVIVGATFLLKMWGLNRYAPDGNDDDDGDADADADTLENR